MPAADLREPVRAAAPAAAATADITQQAFVFAVPVDVGPPGYAVSVSWPAVPGVPNADLAPEVDRHAVTIGAALGAGGARPADLALRGPDGSTVWAIPGESPAGAPPLGTDLRILLETALGSALETAAAGAPLAATFTLVGKAGSRVTVTVDPARGSLARRFAGVHTTVLAGEPAAAAWLTGLSTERPATATGDLTVRYDGFRLLADLSDPVPAGQGGVGGWVVDPGGGPVLRAFPPAGYGGLPLARVGLVGRATADCALAVSLVRYDGGRPGEPVGPAATATVAAGARLGTVWLDLPADTGAAGTGGGAFALSVQASAGRFLWATGDGAALARFAVADPDPEPAALRLGPATLCTVGVAGVHLPHTDLSTAPFTAAPSTAAPSTAAPPAAAPSTASPSAAQPTAALPALDCPLFVHVDVSDLVLRYQR